MVDEHLNSYNSPFKYNGKEFDAETGNYYYGARYYDPKWSIFISVDPLAEKFPSYSTYNYTLNNPIRFIDPDGRAPQDHIFYFRDGKFEKMVDTGKGNKLYFNINGRNVSLSPSASQNSSYFQKVSEHYARQVGFKGTVNHKISNGGDSNTGAYYNSYNKSITTLPNAYLNDNLYDTKSAVLHEYHHTTQQGEMSYIMHAQTYMYEAQQSDFGKTSDNYKANNAYQFANRLINAINLEEYNTSPKSMDDYIKEYNSLPNTLKINLSVNVYPTGHIEGSIQVQGNKTQYYEKLNAPED